MTRTRPAPMAWPLFVALPAALLLHQGCDDGKPGQSTQPTAPAAPTASTPAARGPGSATTTAAVTTAAVAAPGGTASAAPPAVSAPAGPAKTYDCGAKGQKPCPMQGWMKKVMASASSGGDGDALAKALTYVADHPPPGYGEWVGFARAGAARAKTGDVDGAKVSCKQCHDVYKEKYKLEMRDRPF